METPLNYRIIPLALKVIVPEGNIEEAIEE